MAFQSDRQWMIFFKSRCFCPSASELISWDRLGRKPSRIWSQFCCGGTGEDDGRLLLPLISCGLLMELLVAFVSDLAPTTLGADEFRRKPVPCWPWPCCGEPSWAEVEDDPSPTPPDTLLSDFFFLDNILVNLLSFRLRNSNVLSLDKFKIMN